MSWADTNLNDDPTEGLAQRITDLETNITNQLAALRSEIGFGGPPAHGDGAGAGAPAALIGDLEEQLARAVTVSLSAALDAIRESLTAAVSDAVQQLADQLVAVPHATQPLEIQEVAASLQHAVLLALSSFEPASAAASSDPFGGPATSRDVARVNQRIDELRALLLG